jgi:hypothetical protein
MTADPGSTNMRPSSKSWHRLAAVGIIAAGLVVSAAPTALAQSDVIYTTDFANPTEVAPEWGFQRSETSETGNGYALDMVPGALVVSVSRLSNFWISPNREVVGELPDDQTVETTIAEADGDDSLTAGVVCRGSLDDDLGYIFLIGTDGFFTIGDASSNARLVNKKGTKRSDAIDPNGPNTVRGECTTVDEIGAPEVRLTLYVNDEKVASVIDRSAAEVGPEAWIITDVDRGRRAEVSFSSFTVAAA